MITYKQVRIEHTTIEMWGKQVTIVLPSFWKKFNFETFRGKIYLPKMSLKSLSFKGIAHTHIISLSLFYTLSNILYSTHTPIGYSLEASSYHK